MNVTFQIVDHDGVDVGKPLRVKMRVQDIPLAYDNVHLPGLTHGWDIPDRHSLIVADVTRDYELEDDLLVLSHVHVLLEIYQD